MNRLPLLLLLLGCGPRTGPLGIVIADDGQTWAGAAVVDITPEITETFTDLDGDYLFDGCFDAPAGGTDSCPEPFDDVDGDGWFDATFIGGFSPNRPARSVNDAITARAFVLSHGGEYVAFVALDLVGLGSPRIHAARDLLVVDGFDGDRLLVSSTHNHQGPDTMGLWGDPEDLAAPISGLNEAYQQQVVSAIGQAVREAAAQMAPVELKVGEVRMRDRSDWFNGSVFGGKNPTEKMHGLVHDIRDPVLASDQVLVVQGVGEEGTVFTWTSFSAHPEVRGGSNDALSSDWVGAMREVLEATYGGVAVHTPESLGGMQSALGGDLPLVDTSGDWVWQTCEEADVEDPEHDCYGAEVGSTRTDADGEPVPEWAEHGSWDFVRSHGQHVADAAIAALGSGEVVVPDPIRVDVEPLYVPIDNVVYQVLGPAGIFDLALDDAVLDTSLCPEASSGPGCIETRTFRLEMGPLGFVAVPGELLPELAWGLPEDDPLWVTEAADPGARGEDSRYFPQHDGDCDGIEYTECTSRETVGDCDCLKVHAWPYRLSPDDGAVPLLAPLDTRYKAVLGMTDDYLSYIVPEPDFNTWTSLLVRAGDHYEDTVSPSPVFATRLQEAQAKIAARWEE